MGQFIFCGEAFIQGCTPVHRLYEFELIWQMSHTLIWSIWPQFSHCTIDVWTYTNFKRSVDMYCGIPWNFSCTRVQKLYESRLWSQMFYAIFNVFGGNSNPVQLMYGRTANFKWAVQMYCGIAENYGCTPVQKVYESGLRSQMFHTLFQSFWG